MRTRLDLDLGPGIDGGNLGRNAQHSLGNRQIKIIDQVITVTHELFVRLLLDQYEQVARNAAMSRRIAFATDRKLHALADPRRDFEFDHLLAAHGTFTVAFRTGIRNDLALAVAGGTGLGRLRPAEESIDHL